MAENGTLPQNSSESTAKPTYAGVLSKPKVPVADLSNNNPEEVENISNGNPESSASVPSSNSQESAISENASSVLSITPDSIDCYEDAEDDQSNMNTFSADSVMSNGTLTKDETPSSLVTECSSEIKSNDFEPRNSSSPIDYSENEVESDLEDDMSGIEDRLYPNAMRWKFRSKPITDLPKTVTVLETKHGSKVFVVGTAHFSLESQEDVAKTIRAVQPDFVVLELCKNRVNILSLDEASILEEAKSLNLQGIKQTIAANGFLQGVFHLLLVSMCAHLTKELGMAPGGEFRRAYKEARVVPGSVILFGDRPIEITLNRALAKLSFFQKIRIGWCMLRSKPPITKEDVERCKQKDLLEQMLAEMTGEFPELSQVFVKERDLFLTNSLQMAATPIMPAQNSQVAVPSYVVGVVGIGHVPGIVENWDKVTDEDIPPLLLVPEPTMSSKLIRYTIRYSFYGLGLYGVYKLFPRSLLPTRLLDTLKQPFGF